MWIFSGIIRSREWGTWQRGTYKWFPSMFLFLAPRKLIRLGSECSSPTMVGPTSCREAAELVSDGGVSDLPTAPQHSSSKSFTGMGIAGATFLPQERAWVALIPEEQHWEKSMGQQQGTKSANPPV